MRGPWRLLVLVAGVAVAVALFFVLRGGDETEEVAPPPPPPPSQTTTDSMPRRPPPPPQPSAVVVRVNANAERIVRATIPRGRVVVLLVQGPVGEEVHLHGYDVKRRITPSGRVRLIFRATIPGRFEVELEHRHVQIADLSVRP